MSAGLLHRRVRAFALLSAYLALTLAAPLAHLARHADDHRHDRAGAIDWRAVTSSGTGRVDLDKLARAIGQTGDRSHDEAHRRGRAHEHGAPAKEPRGHGEGSFAHFGVALGSGLNAPAPEPASPIAQGARTPSQVRTSPFLASRILHSQRAQAPPRG